MRNRFSLAAIAAICLLAPVAGAQTSEKRTLTIDGARRAISAAVAEAARRKVGAVVAVVDDGGNLMALVTFPISVTALGCAVGERARPSTGSKSSAKASWFPAAIRGACCGRCASATPRPDFVTVTGRNSCPSTA